MDKTLDAIFLDCKRYCSDHGLQLHLCALTRGAVGFEKSSDFPSAWLCMDWLRFVICIHICIYVCCMWLSVCCS